jgi:hypothetical protein
VLVQPMSSNVTMMIDAIFIKRAKPPNALDGLPQR